MNASVLPVDDDAAWLPWRRAWRLRDDTTYLNHGSFGPPPQPVRSARRQWIDRLDEQPMDFFVRAFEPALLDARDALAEFVGTTGANLALVENATAGMNAVADSFPLTAGDEVALTDHEYGAVRRIWQRACRRAGTAEPKIVALPPVIEWVEQVVDAIFSQLGGRTRLLIVSHITSPTAIILPVAEICRRARAAGVAVCVDGPHAPAQVPIDLDALDCDFFTASCHKWLCAPFGSGFLYVHPRRAGAMRPPTLSWGRVLPALPETWNDEFVWPGTRDPSAFLSVPAAIQFMRDVGLAAFRRRTHHLARYARTRLVELTGNTPPVPDSPLWYGSMALVPIRQVDTFALQGQLWRRFGIEVPVIPLAGRCFVRVSCHLYNTHQDIDHLVDALGELL